MIEMVNLGHGISLSPFNLRTRPVSVAKVNVRGTQYVEDFNLISKPPTARILYPPSMLVNLLIPRVYATRTNHATRDLYPPLMKLPAHALLRRLITTSAPVCMGFSAAMNLSEDMGTINSLAIYSNSMGITAQGVNAQDHRLLKHVKIHMVAFLDLAIISSITSTIRHVQV